MNKTLNENIVKKYPDFFPLPENPRTLKDTFFYFRCGDGWFNLINSCCYTISNHLKNKKEITPFYFTQIKEKFGGLRLYYEGGDEFIQGVVRTAEAISYKICEETGNPGCLYAKSNGWIQTLCPERAVGLEKYISNDVL
jgi:hypothetical protein